MPNPLIRKLENGAKLTDEDHALLKEVSASTVVVGPRQDLIREGDRPSDVHLILEGLACRYKDLPDGGRQILAYLIAGDFCDIQIAILGEMDHSISTLSTCTLVRISPSDVDRLLARPTIARALWWTSMVDEGTLREWLVGLGRRSAEKRAAHLFCELFVRMGAVGMAQGDGYDLPVTQHELSDTLGLSDVHTNRTLRALRETGMLEFRDGRVHILDWAGLQSFCAFDSNYLHLRSAKQAQREPHAERAAQA